MDETTTPVTNVDMAILGEAIAKGINANNPKKMSFGEYTRRRNANRPKLRRTYFENGSHVSIDVLSNSEIDLLNQIHRTGRYIDRLVEVVVEREGPDEVVKINWNCRTRDQSFELKGKARNCEDMLQQIVAAQKEEDAEDAEIEQHRKRIPFSSKATREARERAEAQ